MQSILDFLSSVVFNVSNFLKLQFEYIIASVSSFFVFIGDVIMSCVDGIISVLGVYVSIIVQVVQNSITFLSLWGESYVEYCEYYYYYFFDRVYDLVLYFLKFSFYWLLRLLDFSVNLAYDISMYCLEQLPVINLPSGFDVGMRYFVGFGMILNSFLPFAEMVGFIVIILVARICAFCFKFVPFIGRVVR
ncbi:MAG: hypothetical protein LBE18_01320 [Planctomycetaceae bacterium]|jgi:hypothetical protein|nr:hypothetical protein [Planctomycetaceae bacterium]